MTGLTGAILFWLAVMGATIGWLLGYWIGREGITQSRNIIWGIAGALSGGYIAAWTGFAEVLGFGLLGTMTMLFLANVFHLHHVEDETGDITRGLRIRRKGYDAD